MVVVVVRRELLREVFLSSTAIEMAWLPERDDCDR
jgi:hypothetical protein